MKKLILVVSAVCALFIGERISAAEKTLIVEVPKEVAVNPETGEFCMDVIVDSEEVFAGLEFGVICSEGCEVIEVSYGVDASSTGPTEAQGVTWFGFFDGKDSFRGEVLVTIEGKCELGRDSAVSFQEVKKYTIGEAEYKEESISVNTIVNLQMESVEMMEISDDTTALVETIEGNGINAIWKMAVCVTIAAIAAGALIYIFYFRKKKQRGEE